MTATPVWRRLSSKELTVDGFKASREGRKAAIDANFVAAVKSNESGKPDAIEQTLRRRPSVRRGFGSRVSDEQLLARDFEAAGKNGETVNIEVDRSAESTQMPIGKTKEIGANTRFWQKKRLQPMNPHFDMATYKALAPKKSRMRDGTTLQASRDRKNHAHSMTTDQVYAIADRYAAAQWYGIFWKFFRRWDLDKLKEYRKMVHGFGFILIGIMGSVLLYLYFCEVDCFLQLEEADQKDLMRVLRWIRISEFKQIGLEIVEEHDPLHVMSPVEQMRLVITECRERGLTTLDPALAKRRYNSLLKDFDLYHMFYWTTMNFGYVFGGRGLGFWHVMNDVENENMIESLGQNEYFSSY